MYFIEVRADPDIVLENFKNPRVSAAFYAYYY